MLIEDTNDSSLKTQMKRYSFKNVLKIVVLTIYVLEVFLKIISNFKD